MIKESILKTFAVFLVISVVPGPTLAEIPSEIQPRLGIVHFDRGNIKTYYDYVAAIPAHIFHYRDVCYQSPLVVDSTEKWADHFHEDLSAYFGKSGGLEQIVKIGDVPESRDRAMRDSLFRGLQAPEQHAGFVDPDQRRLSRR